MPNQKWTRREERRTCGFVRTGGVFPSAWHGQRWLRCSSPISIVSVTVSTEWPGWFTSCPDASDAAPYVLPHYVNFHWCCVTFELPHGILTGPYQLWIGSQPWDKMFSVGSGGRHEILTLDESVNYVLCEGVKSLLHWCVWGGGHGDSLTPWGHRWVLLPSPLQQQVPRTSSHQNAALFHAETGQKIQICRQIFWRVLDKLFHNLIVFLFLHHLCTSHVSTWTDKIVVPVRSFIFCRIANDVRVKKGTRLCF